MKLNERYLELADSYLFSTIARKVETFQNKHPKRELIRMGIGDVTRPLCPLAVEALHRAADEMGNDKTFRGYGPEQGYPFLRDAIRAYYGERGISLEEGDLFVSDGAKSDLGNLLELFSEDNTVLIPDPVYPAYVDANRMDGRNIRFLDANVSNGFLPMPDPSVQADIIYLCSPNNPTGAVYSREQLAQWVQYALEHDALILFDAAYESFIREPGLARSIYEVEGARRCAVEISSFSKMAGFTGMRCGYTVVPVELEFAAQGGRKVPLNRMWLRRQTTKFNGVPYVIQRAAEAVLTPEGQKQLRSSLNYYAENAQVMANTLQRMGIWFTGGTNAPYLWMKCPNEMDSWEFFDFLLNGIGVVGTPGQGFGRNGEGFFRLSAFGSRKATARAMELMERVLA